MEAVIENKVDELWDSYWNVRSSDSKNMLILNYIWLVRYVLHKMTLPNHTILDTNDFLAIGVLGLYETIDRYDPNKGVKFETYAIPRIRGIVQDELRKLDWLSRSTRKRAHEFTNISDVLRSENGEVNSSEIMKRLDIDSATYRKYLAAAAAAKASLSFNENKNVTIEGEEYDLMDTLPDNEAKNILDDLAQKEKVDILIDNLSQLKTKHRLVISLYYYEDLTFKEIGKTLKLTESRVCQIHSQVLKDLKSKLYNYENA
jgi:RNA polymerase sigma factor for flagellar operon FliA